MKEYGTDFLIENQIPEGYENRISRQMLAEKCGLSDREMRSCIQDAVKNRNAMIINLDKGYFIPKETDRERVRNYHNRELKRAISVLMRVKKVEHYLDDDKNQMKVEDLKWD